MEKPPETPLLCHAAVGAGSLPWLAAERDNNGLVPNKSEFRNAFTCYNKSKRINKKKAHVVFRITCN